LFAPAVLGQRLDGTLRGTILDSSGAVVPGAKVTVTNQATGVEQTIETSSAGIYVFPNLLVGSYTLTVKAAGFAVYTRKNVDVASNQVVEANITLTVGATATTMEVTAGASGRWTATCSLSRRSRRTPR
jgi:hypothetical protein